MQVSSDPFLCNAKKPRLKKTSKNTSKIEEVSNFDIISPMFFKGLSIFVDIPNENIKNAVETTLAVSGASISKEKQEKHDLIITEKRQNIIRKPRTQGGRLLAAAEKVMRAPTIQLSQIPWAVHLKKINDTPKPVNPKAYLVVIAAPGFQPVFKNVFPFPELNICHVAKDCLSSPFVYRFPEEKNNVILPPRKIMKLCPICKQHFNVDDDLHRQSKRHQQAVHGPSVYCNLDALIENFPCKLFVC